MSSSVYMAIGRISLHLDDKPVLYVTEYFLVLGRGYEGHGYSLSTEPTCSTYSVQVTVRGVRHIVVDDYVYSLYVYSSAEDVGGHHDSPLEFLEQFVPLDSELVNCSREVTVL